MNVRVRHWLGGIFLFVLIVLTVAVLAFTPSSAATFSTQGDLGSDIRGITTPPIEKERPDGILSEQEASQEDFYAMEREFLILLNEWRESQGLAAIEKRLNVLDDAAGIQNSYLSENPDKPLTHTTDIEWLVENYPNEVAILGIQPVVRTRARVQLASYLNTGDPEINYAESGGVTEVIVRGANNASDALTALLESAPHAAALSDEHPDIGIVAQEDDWGRVIFVVVLGKALDSREWPLSKRAMMGLDEKVNLPAIMNDK